jgi:hypothetical protein
MFILDKLHEVFFGKQPIVPAEGHVMVKPKDWRDIPLSGPDLARAKVMLAKKLDSSWEDR